MQNNRLLQKGLTIGIILLFISITLSPSVNFNIAKAAQENDFIEVTSEACGIKGYGNTTVKLTREQYENLENYMVGFRERLNQTTTREEAVPIFKEAVVELEKYGLLPKGMSVQQAQKLVTYEYFDKKTIDILSSYTQKKMDMIEKNFFCLTAGHIFNCCFVTPLFILGIPLVIVAIYGALIAAFSYLSPFEYFITTLCMFFFLAFYTFSTICPVSFLLYSDFEDCILSTIGLLGKRSIIGPNELIGFIGLKLMIEGSIFPTKDVYLLGTSLYVGPS